MSGMMSTTGWPTTGPTRCGTAISDILGGLNLTIGVLAAYVRRQKTGIGDMVDVSLVDSTVSAMEIINMIYLIEGRTPSRIGNRYEAIYPYDSFDAKDGQAIIACGNDKLFGLLKGVIRDPELEAEEFASNALRVKNHADLKPIVEKWTKVRTIDEITDTLLAAGIPASPINTIDRVVKDPHIADAREMFVELDHPVAGKMKVTGNQLKFTNNKVHIDTPAPLLSQDTERVLAEIGIGGEEYAALKEQGVF